MPTISELGERRKISDTQHALMDTYNGDYPVILAVRALTLFKKFEQFCALYFQQGGYLFEIESQENHDKKTTYQVSILERIRDHKGAVNQAPKLFSDLVEDCLNTQSLNENRWYDSEESRLFRRQNETHILNYLEKIKTSEQLQDDFLDILAGILTEKELQSITDNYITSSVHAFPTSGKPISKQTMIAELKASDRLFFKPTMSLLASLTIYLSDESWEKVHKFCKSNIKR